MIVRAEVRSTSSIPTPDPTTFALGHLRGKRVLRQMRIRTYLSSPERLNLLHPDLYDLSSMSPGAANDLLRSIRFSKRQMEIDPEHMHAALVALRILCWLKLNR